MRAIDFVISSIIQHLETNMLDFVDSLKTWHFLIPTASYDTGQDLTCSNQKSNMEDNIYIDTVKDYSQAEWTV